MEFLQSLFPNPESDFALIAVFLGLPLLGAIVCAIGGTKLGRDATRFMALSTAFGSFIAAIAAFAFLHLRLRQLTQGFVDGTAAPNTRLVWKTWRWILTL